MNYQLLALDLDGTLTNSRKEITPSTRDALIDIQKNGKKVVLASGRPSQGVLPLAEELHLGDYGSYILSYNGGRITDCRSGEIIYSKYLPNDVAAPLLEIVKKYPGIDILAYTDTELISGGDTNEYSEKESFMICCGDGYNDLTMIETAGLGVAMANAQPLVKESADYITKSNDEDGVLHVINEFMR